MNVIVISHQRSGTHLTIDSIINNFNHFYDEHVNIDHLCSDKFSNEHKEAVKSKINTGNRVIKSHFLPDVQSYCGQSDNNEFIQEVFNQSKKIYILRNGLDVSISFYHYLKRFRKEVENMSFREFLNYDGWPSVSKGRDKLTFWAYHIDQWEKSLYSSNMLFLKYEDWISHYYSTIQKVADYLDLPANKDIKDLRMSNISPFWRKLFKLMNKMGVHNIKRSSVSYRKGTIGEWNKYYDEKLINTLPPFVMEKMKKYGYYSSIKREYHLDNPNL